MSVIEATTDGSCHDLDPADANILMLDKDELDPDPRFDPCYSDCRLLTAGLIKKVWH